ncbi:palmitoyl protein thioesterase, partial [Sporodiniella umbellata]
MYIVYLIHLLFLFALAQRPVVLWHGMGDDCCNQDSMGRITSLIKKNLGESVFVFSVKVGDSIDDDHKSGFFGQLNKQLDKVHQELISIPELKHGFNGVGFSQGGLFLRAFAQKYNQPPVRQLITFGSPHGGKIEKKKHFILHTFFAGVSDIPNCMDPRDFTCRLMKTIVQHGVYTDYVQNKIIQAQYYRNPLDIKTYLEKNRFLPYINNEIQHKDRKKYKANLSSLKKFVMIQFSEDVMIKPAATSWFSVENEDNQLVSLYDQVMYKEDWLGLRKLNESGRLELLVCPGQHMQISDEYFERIVRNYLLERRSQPYQKTMKLEST